MSNRLLTTLANIEEWLCDRQKDKTFYKDAVVFLKEAASILKSVVERLRGKDISQTDQIVNENSILMILNDMIDHIDYIKNMDGTQMRTTLEEAAECLDLARQTIRLESDVIPGIRVELRQILRKVEGALQEDTENINLNTALVRLKGTMNDLSNV